MRHFSTTVLLPCFMVAIGSVFCLNACKNNQQTDTIIAKVYDKQLSIHDLEGVVALGIGKDDSTKAVQNFIDNWLHDQVILHKAEQELSSENSNFDDQIDRYKNSLILYAFESQVFRDNVDTIVSEKEIQTYFKENKPLFQLKEPLFKGRLVLVQKIDDDLPKLTQWYASNNADDINQLYQYCLDHNGKILISDTTWLSLSTALQDVPYSLRSKIDFNSTGSKTATDSSVALFVVNKGHKKVGEQAPLNFERSNIKNLIILKRKQEFLHKFYQDIYDEAVENNEIEQSK